MLGGVNKNLHPYNTRKQKIRHRVGGRRFPTVGLYLPPPGGCQNITAS